MSFVRTSRFLLSFFNNYCVVRSTGVHMSCEFMCTHLHCTCKSNDYRVHVPVHTYVLPGYSMQFTTVLHDM